jgi:cytochrome P450
LVKLARSPPGGGHTTLVSDLAEEGAALALLEQAGDIDVLVANAALPAEWIPYGGGIRRCIGAAFATMEMRLVLRTLLRNYVISPSSARDERWQSRGVAVAPSRGARVRIQPRRETATVIG